MDDRDDKKIAETRHLIRGKLHTEHIFLPGSASEIDKLSDKTVALVVTSPPYPMVQMWDESFSNQNSKVKKYLNQSNYDLAYQEMHNVLDEVWIKLDKKLIDNGFVCINVGDATRNCDGDFRLFSNHSRIINAFEKLGYSVLPDIHWSKPTNSPTKFLGSGMYPAGAYVTYEHEYILIFRKGGKREFRTEEEKISRRESAFFWEERNEWFSDIWRLRGINQKLEDNDTRERSAAYPFELAYRLINMYSIKGDLVLDPFVGTGTTSIAAMASERNSRGIDIEESLLNNAIRRLHTSKVEINSFILNRLVMHRDFIGKISDENRKKFYTNEHHGVLIKTRMETEIKINLIDRIEIKNESVRCYYKKMENKNYRQTYLFARDSQ